MRLIDAEDLKFKNVAYVNGYLTHILTPEEINNAPTVEINDKSLEIARKSIELGRSVGKLEGKLERPQGEWIDYSEDGFVECPFCHKATTCEDNIDELHYCWNCGAEMRKGGNENGN